MSEIEIKHSLNNLVLPTNLSELFSNHSTQFSDSDSLIESLPRNLQIVLLKQIAQNKQSWSQTKDCPDSNESQL